MENLPLILLASARKDSDTKRFVAKVLQETPHVPLDLLDYNISTYRYEKDYPENDQFLEVVGQILQHRVLVFATPVYWYAMSAQMKTFFDRLTDLVTIYKPLGRQLKGKTIFLLAVGTDPDLPDGFEVPFKLTAKYLNMNYGCSLHASTEEIETDIYHLGDHREFLREVKEALAGA